MVHKTTIYRRKAKGFFAILFLCLILFLMVFGTCFGVWYLLGQRLHLKSPLAVSESKKNTYIYSTKIQNYCFEYHVICKTISIDSSTTATVILDDSSQILFSLQKDLRSQFASLQLTQRALTIEGKRFSRLDFRFDKPIISY